MAITKIHRGNRVNGRFIPDRPDEWALAFCKQGRCEVIIQAERKTRSKNQNRYYRGVVIALISQYTGQPPDNVHDAMGYKFLRVDTDSGLSFPRSTTALSTVEMEQYLTEVRQWASEFLGLYIPLPNEVTI